MTAFSDNTGRAWEVVVTVATLKRVRSLAGVDLMDIADPDANLIGRLAADPVLLVDSLFAVVKPQADARGVTDEEFGAALAGDAVADATDAMLEAVVDFFPHAPSRSNLRAVLTKTRGAMDRVAEVGAEMIESGVIDREIDEAIGAMRRSISGEPSTGSPESSASIPPA